MINLVYAVLIAIAAYAITDALFDATWLSVLVTILALIAFFLLMAGKFLISFCIIAIASLFGEKKSLKEIWDEAMGDTLDDDLFEVGGGDDD